MTYPELLSAIYGGYERLIVSWNAEMENAGSLGAFVFMPEGYASAIRLNEVKYQYWSMDRIREFVGLDVEGDAERHREFLDLLRGFAFGNEFLVLIVESLPGEKRRAVHLHRITNVGTN
jgi:hypothetical protein